MLPTAAFDLLRLDIADAETLALQGEVAAGLELLRAGWLRAQAAGEQGHRWAAAWIGCYQEALDNYLRRYGLPTEAAAPRAEPPVPVVRSGVLVVDDDAESRRALRELLEAEGYPVASVEDGQAALASLRRSPRPCLILLDLLMPRMAGWEFRQEQRQDLALATLPVVIMSGVPISLAQAERLGAEGYLQKPYDPAALLALVAHY